MDTPSTISVLVATHNRADVLEKTLRAFAKVDTRGLSVEWVIIDNNSKDATRTIIDEFKRKFPLLYLFEPKPGKNCALNAALREMKLGEIVVFADDDITPDRDWLQQVALSCALHPDYAVFGGRIFPEWPSGREPWWARDRFVQMFGFSLHDFGEETREYEPGVYPFGPNFWIRRKIVEQGHKYDERVGPRPANRIMGSETTFLRDIQKAGFKQLYYPQASVLHRISGSGCSAAVVKTRAFRLGRGEIYVSGLPRPALLASSRFLWDTYILMKLIAAILIRLCATLSFSRQTRLLREVSALRMMGNALESWKHANERGPK